MGGDAEQLVDELTTLVGFGVVRSVLASVVVLAAILALRWLFMRVVERQIDEAAPRYRVRKTANWVTLALALAGLGTVWAGALGTFVTVFALAAAGLAISLGEVIRNLAGGVYIALRHPVRVGDRIEIGDVAGDVVDTSPLAFHVLEIRNWVEADQSTGRIVHVPNSMLFTRPLANFGAGFEWIWHEVPVPLTFESDWQRARGILTEIVNRHAPQVDPAVIAERLKAASRRFLITYGRLGPAVYLDADERGVRLTVRVLCEIRKRRGLTDAIWSDVLESFAAEPGIQLAYPPVRAYVQQAQATEPPRSDEEPAG